MSMLSLFISASPSVVASPQFCSKWGFCSKLLYLIVLFFFYKHPIQSLLQGYRALAPCFGDVGMYLGVSPHPSEPGTWP